MVPKTEKPEISDYQGKIREKNWLGSKDSNLDCMIQSHVPEGQTPSRITAISQIVLKPA